jgi:hypothetical protein
MLKTMIRDLEAFCTHCPAASAVTATLQALTFDLTFQMDEYIPAESSHVAALPAQYHYKDQYGTEIIYLAGRDTPENGGRLPAHLSRFWLWPGSNEQAYTRAAEMLARTYHLCWLNSPTGK